MPVVPLDPASRDLDRTIVLVTTVSRVLCTSFGTTTAAAMFSISAEQNIAVTLTTFAVLFILPRTTTFITDMANAPDAPHGYYPSPQKASATASTSLCVVLPLIP